MRPLDARWFELKHVSYVRFFNFLLITKVPTDGQNQLGEQFFAPFRRLCRCFFALHGVVKLLMKLTNSGAFVIKNRYQVKSGHELLVWIMPRPNKDGEKVFLPRSARFPVVQLAPDDNSYKWRQQNCCGLNGDLPRPHAAR